MYTGNHPEGGAKRFPLRFFLFGGRFTGEREKTEKQEAVKPDEGGSGSGEEHGWTPPFLSRTVTKSKDCFVLQALLVVRGFDCGSAGVDGYFGKDTQAAVNAARKFYGMDEDGTCDSELWSRLLKTEGG